MNGSGTTGKYSRGIVTIHWMSAFLIFILFPLGKYMSGLDPIEKLGLIKFHGILGLIIFLLTIARSVLFFTTKRPEKLNTGSWFNDLIAMVIHRAFYILLLLIGVSGIVTLVLGGYLDAISIESTNLILPRDEISPLLIHNMLAVLLIALLAVHVAGVIRFNIKHKTNAIKRMT